MRRLVVQVHSMQKLPAVLLELHIYYRLGNNNKNKKQKKQKTLFYGPDRPTLNLPIFIFLKEKKEGENEKKKKTNKTKKYRKTECAFSSRKTIRLTGLFWHICD